MTKELGTIIAFPQGCLLSADFANRNGQLEQIIPCPLRKLCKARLVYTKDNSGEEGWELKGRCYMGDPTNTVQNK